MGGMDAAVTTAFKAKDAGMTAALRRITNQTRKFGTTSQKSFRQASAAANRHNSVLRGILSAGVVTSGIALLTRGAISVTQEFIKFDDSIMGAAARFKDIGPDAKDFEARLQEIKKSARDAGATTEFTASQAAEALDFMARAGFNSKEAMKGLVPMINLATASGEDFARTSDMASDLLGAFGMEASTTEQKIASLTRLNDVLVKSANSANVTIESQFETMKQAAPIFATFGDNLEQVAAITAAMGNAGIKGSQGATALKNGILRLAAPTKNVYAGMAKLGLSIDDISTVGADGKRNMNKLTDILKTMGPMLKKLGTKDRAMVMDQIFGKRAIAGMGNVQRVIDTVIEFEDVLKKSGGTSAKTAALMRQSLGNQLKTLQSAAFELGFKFLDAFKGKGLTGIQSMTEAIRKFDIQPIVDTVKMLVTVVKVFYKVLSPFAPLLPYIVGGMIAYNIATKVHLALMSGGAIVNVIRFIRLMMVMNRLRGLSATLQWALNFAMSANPIGVVIIAMTALIAVGVLLYRNWDYVKTKFMELTAVFDNPTFRGIAMVLSPLITIPILIIRNWSRVVSVLRTVTGWLVKISEMGSVFNIAKKAFGYVTESQKPKEDTAAHELERARARTQTINFKGNIDINGAPPGSRASSQTSGAPPVNMNMVGAQ